ncbi:MAG: methylated-DNA--[protein]-cysteine S-methyltransferase [Micromonosporaceae bacterium]
MRWTVVSTPLTELLVGADEGGVCRVGLGFHADRSPPGPRADHDPVLREASAQLTAYAAGELTDFTLPLSIRRGSGFERSVWEALCEIPYGETCSYGAIAKQVGDPDAARAVGVANNRNPIAIVIPCHRVIGADGKLVGYGGGLDLKRKLLELEARVTIERNFAF